MNRTCIPQTLMYHGITEKDSPIPLQRETGASLYDVNIEQFKEQMEYLTQNGYQAITIEDIEAHQGIIITFDDGEMNNFTNAYPILKQFQLTAYFFVIGKRVGKPGYMSFTELKELKQNGMHIGSHGLSHEILTNLKKTQIEEELMASKKYLERNLDMPVTTLSIPRGFCNEEILSMANNAGYQHIFISDRPEGLKKNLGISRIAVKGKWPLKRFVEALNGEIPVQEKAFNRIKNLAKKWLPESGYNQIRSLILKVVK